ncbi:hypothetical protein AND_002317 [Anopheles darlingi]|uniref:Uncharacterized protein n=1 Tax=Anopheles darlingi TaxID=43151 RepID=W5JT57_ANODA|nr:hypothetical protein AND_002317 [Anopheles darlingi]
MLERREQRPASSRYHMVASANSSSSNSSNTCTRSSNSIPRKSNNLPPLVIMSCCWVLVVLCGCLAIDGVPLASGLPEGGGDFPVGRFPFLMPKVVPYKVSLPAATASSSAITE